MRQVAYLISLMFLNEASIRPIECHPGEEKSKYEYKQALGDDNDVYCAFTGA